MFNTSTTCYCPVYTYPHCIISHINYLLIPSNILPALSYYVP